MATYNKNIESRMLFVGGLRRYHHTEEMLWRYFSVKYGPIERIDYKPGFAFIRFVLPEDRQNALRARWQSIGGYEVEVKPFDREYQDTGSRTYVYRGECDCCFLFVQIGTR